MDFPYAVNELILMLGLFEGQKRDAFHQSKADTVPYALKAHLPRNRKSRKRGGGDIGRARTVHRRI
ncbi:putative electron transfer flavoprotein subunit YdiR [Bienertia sinuspersici]